MLGDLTAQGFQKKKIKLLAPYISDEGGGGRNGGSPVGAPTSPGGSQELTPQQAMVGRERGHVRSPSSEFINPMLQTKKDQASESRIAAVQQARANLGDFIPMPVRRATGVTRVLPVPAGPPTGQTQPTFQQTQPTFQLPPPTFIPPSPDEGNPASAAGKTPPPTRAKPVKQLGPPVLPKDPALRESPRMIRHVREGSSSSTGSGSLKKGQHIPPQQAPETMIESMPGRMVAGEIRGGVSNKIQQLLNTLKRPKKSRKPIEEYYQDDSRDLAPQSDPNAPKPVGPQIQPAVGVPLQNLPEWHRNMEAAIQHYSISKAKQPAISVIDANGKFASQLTYGKLASKALKVAHFLLNKLGGGKILKPGDRVRRDLLFVALMKDITQYT